ncbi:hypothetical protein UFOVP125_21 [uncultured Caudovirales phage]|uniref:Uncharacterized protein n=1 Tax=uncultured Caudovirales phage TaxID=2100421 RepID=A0A6J5LBZ6_9CAUD|nr:hypothetical protein UFOVP125_21 [uncultured Caudovirales phage]
MMRRIGLRELLKEPFKKPTPLEVIAAELAEAHLAKLQAETGVEYAQSIVDYNLNRIERLNKRMEEYK